MVTWRLKLFLYPIALWDCIMGSTQPKIDKNTISQITYDSRTLFFNVITKRIFSTTLQDFSPPAFLVSNIRSATPEVRTPAGDADSLNTLSVVFTNENNDLLGSNSEGSGVSNSNSKGSGVSSYNSEGGGVFSSNGKGNFTALNISSHLDLNEGTIEAKNIIGNNTTKVMEISGKMASQVIDTFVVIIVRCGLFFGGIALIFLVGIGIYRARTHCQPEWWYDKI